MYIQNVKLNDIQVWDQSENQSQQNIRCLVMDHLTSSTTKNDDQQLPFEMMNDDEADEARKYFGVF